VKVREIRKLVIVGNTGFAEIAYEYFSHDSGYEVVAFSVERDFIGSETMLGLPVVPFESLERHFPPSDHRFFVAATYTQMNRLRRRLYEEARRKGYLPASYISSRAFVWRNCRIGEHCFIFEDNTVQPFVEIGDNVILWSGNHIGHHSRIGSHTFISSHVVISGYVEVGEECFFGVNATVANNVRIGSRCLIGAGALVLGDVPDGQKVVGVWKRRGGGG
jgi:sugar O-acyltransferase (sialic acid O-acetyltransferase NeuD family)